MKSLLKRVSRKYDIPPIEIVWNGDPWCRANMKTGGTIFMADMGNYWANAQLLLHEITHVFEGGGHGIHFWDRLRGLTQEFIGMGLNRHNTEMKKDYLNE